jgi:hypothetical protein
VKQEIMAVQQAMQEGSVIQTVFEEITRNVVQEIVEMKNYLRLRL